MIVSVAIFFLRAVLPAGAMTRRWVPQTRCTVWRNTASIMTVWFIDVVVVDVDGAFCCCWCCCYYTGQHNFWCQEVKNDFRLNWGCWFQKWSCFCSISSIFWDIQHFWFLCDRLFSSVFSRMLFHVFVLQFTWFVFQKCFYCRFSRQEI